MPLTIATPSTIASAVSAVRSLRRASSPLSATRVIAGSPPRSRRAPAPRRGGRASLTIRPSARKRTRSAIAAARGVVGDHHGRLAVARRRTPRSSSRISPLVRESRLPVGSSAKRTVGRETSARAIATRCCWPPESSAGRCLRRSARPTVVEQLVEPRPVGLAAGDRQRQEDVLLGGQHRQQVEELEDEADVRRRSLVSSLSSSAVISVPSIVDRARASGGRGRRGCASASTCRSPRGP